MTSHTAEELSALEHVSGLLVAGYVAAGEPRVLVPLLIRPERWPERRALVLAANGRGMIPPSTAATRLQRK